MTNLEKLKAELQQMTIDEIIDHVALCDRIDTDIKAKYCKNEGECGDCCREWLNREVNYD